MNVKKHPGLIIFGSLAIITFADFRPIALRPRLLPGLPFSVDGFILFILNPISV
jgi:hypothetical protein